MTNIIFLCDWGESSSELKKTYNSLTPKLDFKWKNIKIVDKIEDAEWYIFLGQKIKINIDTLDKNKMIIIQREPYQSFNNYGILNYYNYKNYIHLFSVSWHIGRNYNQLINLNIKNSRTKLCSAIVSKLIFQKPIEAYKIYSLRVNFIKILSEISDFDIDIYGYNWKKEDLGEKYKGTLGGFNIGTVSHINNLIPNTTKFDGLYDYKYSIAIENCKKNNYITEKFTDCILCGTIPIYYGADNVDEYFPKDCYYKIDIESPKCLVELKKILNKPITQKNIIALNEARHLILNKYNMINKIYETINQK